MTLAAFNVISSKSGKRVGYMRLTEAGRWMALAYVSRMGEEDAAGAELGHYLDRDVAMEAIELAWHALANPKPEDRCGVEINVVDGELAADAF